MKTLDDVVKLLSDITNRGLVVQHYERRILNIYVPGDYVTRITELLKYVMPLSVIWFVRDMGNAEAYVKHVEYVVA